MSVQDSFNEDEWFLLSSTPAMIGAIVSAADSSGVIGTVKELSASMRSTVAALQDYPDSELVQQLLKKAENWEDAKEKLNDYKARSQERLSTDKIKSPADLQEQVLGDVRRCLEMVDTRCSAADARVYREWSMKIAHNVAKASREGGFLGFGGTEVSDDEKILLTKIEAALGVSSATLLA